MQNTLRGGDRQQEIAGHTEPVIEMQPASGLFKMEGSAGNVGCCGNGKMLLSTCG
eukprot:m.432810 g.432810  ORF g.432810 m.432810 type:complete len:55 (-) comp21414_c1_seq9:1089-1253(-)